jgi:hypothetical protein
MQIRGNITKIARGYLVVGEVVYYWSGMEEVDYVLFYQDKSAANLCHLVSISPTFYEHLLRLNPFAKKLQTQIVST